MRAPRLSTCILSHPSARSGAKTVIHFERGRFGTTIRRCPPASAVCVFTSGCCRYNFLSVSPELCSRWPAHGGYRPAIAWTIASMHARFEACSAASRSIPLVIRRRCRITRPVLPDARDQRGPAARLEGRDGESARSDAAAAGRVVLGVRNERRADGQACGSQAGDALP